MFIAGIWNNNEVSSIIWFCTIAIIFFYAIGRILRLKWKFLETNEYLTLPIGFIAYFLLTWILYSFFILFRVDTEFMKWVDILKDSFLILTILILYKSWVPTRSDFNYKKLINISYGVISFGVVLTTFYLFDLYFEWFNNIDLQSTYYQELIRMDSVNAVSKFSPYTDNYLNALGSSQTFYNYISTISFINGISIINTLSFIVPFFTIIILFFSILELFSLKNKKIFWKILTIPIVIGIICAIQNKTSLSSIFISTSLIIFIFVVLIIDSNNYTSTNNYIIFSMLSSILLFSFNTYGIFISLTINISILIYAIWKKKKIILNLIVFISTYGLAIFFPLFNFEWWIGVISVFIFLLLFVPLWTLQSSNKRNDLITSEYKIQKNINYSLTFISFIFLITLTITIFWNLDTYGNNLLSFLENSTIFFNNVEQNTIFNSIIYFTPLIFTVLLFLYSLFKKIKLKKVTIMLLFFTFIFLNPVSYTLWEFIFVVDISDFIFLIPIYFLSIIIPFEVIKK